MWLLACGAYDRDLRGRAFWMGSFGKPPTAADLIDMHPLRRAGGTPPDKPPELRAAESKAGWKLVDKFFAQTKG